MTNCFGQLFLSSSHTFACSLASAPHCFCDHLYQTVGNLDIISHLRASLCSILTAEALSVIGRRAQPGAVMRTHRVSEADAPAWPARYARVDAAPLRKRALHSTCRNGAAQYHPFAFVHGHLAFSAKVNAKCDHAASSSILAITVRSNVGYVLLVHDANYDLLHPANDPGVRIVLVRRAPGRLDCPPSHGRHALRRRSNVASERLEGGSSASAVRIAANSIARVRFRRVCPFARPNAPAPLREFAATMLPAACTTTRLLNNWRFCNA